jgi:hypothetical protein
VAVEIHGHRQKHQLLDGAIAKRGIYASAPDHHLKAVGNFKPPEDWDHGAGLGHLLEQRVGGRRAFAL